MVRCRTTTVAARGCRTRDNGNWNACTGPGLAKACGGIARDGSFSWTGPLRYPFLTERLIEDAEIYLKAHPRPGRPRRLTEAHPDLRLATEASSGPARGHNG
ncbi:hypothetical protein CS8_006940 [Cupriavidus sp. 8B]